MPRLNNIVEKHKVGLNMAVETETATSESEEMYLIHIAMAGEEGVQGPVGLSRLAEMLSVSPISVNQMVKKLVGRDLVVYVPYKGVELTGPGRAIADQVLRRRRFGIKEKNAAQCSQQIAATRIFDNIQHNIGARFIGWTGLQVVISKPVALGVKMVEAVVGSADP